MDKLASDQEAKLRQEQQSAVEKARLGEAFSDLGGALGGRGIGGSAQYFKDLRTESEKPLTNFQANQKGVVDQYLKNKYYDTLAQMQKDKLSATSEDKDLDRAAKKENIKASQAQREERANQAQEMRVEKQIQDLSKSLSGGQEAMEAVGQIETELGGPLEEFNSKDGELYQGGKKLDLPGVSIPLFGRVSAYSTPARKLQSKVATVFNTVLKDRSGAAVTTPELERLKIEFGQGNFNTEAELIEAVKKYKGIVLNEMKNREAGFKPEVVQEYAARGGRISANQFPKQVRKGNQTAVVKNEQEEKEARSEGWQ